MSTRKLSERPEKVVLAAKMLYLIIAIGAIRVAMTVFRHIDVRSPYSLIVTKLLIYSAFIFMIWQLGRGKNWARWILVMIFAISIPLSILPTFDSISHNSVHALLGFVQLAMYIAATVFLFQKSSSAWFSGDQFPQ